MIVALFWSKWMVLVLQSILTEYNAPHIRSISLQLCAAKVWFWLQYSYSIPKSHHHGPKYKSHAWLVPTQPSSSSYTEVSLKWKGYVALLYNFITLCVLLYNTIFCHWVDHQPDSSLQVVVSVRVPSDCCSLHI